MFRNLIVIAKNNRLSKIKEARVFVDLTKKASVFVYLAKGGEFQKFKELL